MAVINPSSNSSSSTRTSIDQLDLDLVRVQHSKRSTTSPWPPPIPSTSTRPPPTSSSSSSSSLTSTTKMMDLEIVDGTVERFGRSRTFRNETIIGIEGEGGRKRSDGKGKKKKKKKQQQQQREQQIRRSRLDDDEEVAEAEEQESSRRNAPIQAHEHQVLIDPSIKHCQAFDRWDQRCTRVVVGGHKGKINRNWCLVHQTERDQIKLEFTRCIKALPTASKHLPLPDANEITCCEDLDRLQEWEHVAQQHLLLSSKALACLSYHQLHFQKTAANEPDLKDSMGRMSFEELTLRNRAAEGVIKLVIRRSHLLILTSEDALWLLEPCTRFDSEQEQLSREKGSSCLSGNSTDSTCSSSSSSSTTTIKPPCAPSLQTEEEEPDPILALERVKRAELLELLSLTGSHASFIRNSSKSVQRVRIIECLFRRLISRDEELLVKAYRSGHDHVLRFFEDTSCCSLESLQRLHSSLKRTSSLSLKEAIMDAFRAIAWEESGAGETEPGEEGLGLQLLGGWSYKIQLDRSMTPLEWSHLYDLCGCSGCALKCCRRFTDWVYLRKMTVVSPPPPTLTHSRTLKLQRPPFEDWVDSPNESDASKIFKALGIIKCRESGPGASEPEIRRINGGFVGTKGKGMWIERIERNWIYLKLSLQDPQSLIKLSGLESEHTLLVRTNPLINQFNVHHFFPLPLSNQLWFSRYRSANSKPLLRHQPWSIDQNAFGPNNSNPLSIFDQFDSPELEQGFKKEFDQVWQVIILDGHGRERGEGTGRTANENSNRSFEQFEAEVGQLFCEAIGLDSVGKALSVAGVEAKKEGEFVVWDEEEADEGNSGGRGGLIEKKKSNNKNGNGNGKENGGAALESLRDDDLALKLSRSLFK